MRMKNNLKNTLLGLILLFIIFFLLLANQEFKYPSKEQIYLRVNYLERVINEPLDQDSEIIQLGQESYEWMLFSYSYSTYALTNLALHDESYTERVTPIIKQAIKRTLEEPIFNPYNIEIKKLYADTIPDYSVLYLGHLNLMLGKYRQISGDTTFNKLNDRISFSLYKRYRESDFLNLESYPYSIWIPDNSVAMSSLNLHSKNTGSSYDSIVDDWLNFVKTKYIESETRVLYSMVNPQNGEPFEEPRGSMLGWSIMFISQFDTEFAKELYQNYEKNFSTNLGILQPFKERHDVSKSDIGDIDSGPILLGYSIPANEFAFANSIFAGDLKTAKRIERLINLGTSKQRENDELHYHTRFIDFQISPMAEALVLFSLSTPISPDN